MAIHSPRKTHPERIRRDRQRAVVRDECLIETPFSSTVQARLVLAIWRQDYNTIRSHWKLGRLTPALIVGQRASGHAP